MWLARSRTLTCSRSADDLVFSGAASSSVGVNAAKTRVMRAHQRQRVTGVVVNEQPNISRADFDSLKALLHHRCRLRGLTSRLFDAL